MAGFVTVMSQFMRLCDSYKHCDDCPVNQAGFNCDCDHLGYSKTGAAELEHIIMQWAAEHPEPVYPTWWEWLFGIGAVTRKVKPDVASNLIETGLLDPIPADIAEKLGIEPKEGV